MIEKRTETDPMTTTGNWNFGSPGSSRRGALKDTKRCIYLILNFFSSQGSVAKRGDAIPCKNFFS